VARSLSDWSFPLALERAASSRCYSGEALHGRFDRLAKRCQLHRSTNGRCLPRASKIWLACATLAYFQPPRGPEILTAGLVRVARGKPPMHRLTRPASVAQPTSLGGRSCRPRKAFRLGMLLPGYWTGDDRRLGGVKRMLALAWNCRNQSP
jgi:hypothetical protein